MRNAARTAKGMQTVEKRRCQVSGEKTPKGRGERTWCEQPENPLPVDLQKGTSEDEPKDVGNLPAGAERRQGNVLLVLAREEVDDDVKCAWDAACRADTLDSPKDEKCDLVVGEADSEREDTDPCPEEKTTSVVENRRRGRVKDVQSAAEDPFGRDEVTQLARCEHERGERDGVGVDRPGTLCKRTRSKESVGVSLGSLAEQGRQQARTGRSHGQVG
jgi:hypothetical protein